MKKTFAFQILLFLCMFANAHDAKDYDLFPGNNYNNNPLSSQAMIMQGSAGLSGTLSDTSKQEGMDYRKNAVFFELLGPGVFYSVNYDRRISKYLSLRGGFTTWSLHGILLAMLGIERLSMTAFPIMVNYMTGPMKSNHFEIGAGVMPSFVSGKAFFTEEATSSATVLLGISSIGYRYQRPKRGFFFRADITPLFSAEGAAVSFGLSFGMGF